jgi:hypothetical protein
MTNSTEVVCAVNIYHGGVIIGGHIVLGNAGGGASSVDSATLKDSNRVFIVPLCNACNQQSITQSLPYITPVVQLGGYFFDEDVESFRPGFDSDYYRIHGKTNGQDYNRAWQVQCNHHRQMCDAFRGAGTAHFDSAFMRITI